MLRNPGDKQTGELTQAEVQRALNALNVAMKRQISLQTACCAVFVAATGPLSGCADPGGKDPPHGAEEPPSFLSYRGNSRKGVLMTDGEGGTAVYESDG